MKLSQIAYNQMLDIAIINDKVSLQKADELRREYEQVLLDREQQEKQWTLNTKNL